MGHVGLTSRSPGQILENSCLHSTGYICDQIFMTLCVIKGKQTRSNLRQLLYILVKLRPSNLDHLYNLVCRIELWHFITLNFDLLLHFKALGFRFRPPRCHLLYIKRWQKGTLKYLLLRWASRALWALLFLFPVTSILGWIVENLVSSHLGSSCLKLKGPELSYLVDNII